ncbi:hypothetical protein BDV27DRAFT_125349 [Aspergillus caelatus]|uniref:Uncharacterized protein n=1 Tax=Aspergillus caelatus TaxID=61420 RepID=A0A5N7AAH5_9EURO|nr:uncharacterized protein BDV27DRAFT_125349 [Aspergillus caelatus]KAE8366358.1 hypothetical protein BDV27DRAFT_125349 [Aspergillus caelatus]
MRSVVLVPAKEKHTRFGFQRHRATIGEAPFPSEGPSTREVSHPTTSLRGRQKRGVFVPPSHISET